MGDHMTKKTKKPNPVILEAEKRGYDIGFQSGYQYGRDKAVDFIIDWFNKLEEVPGIGSKTSKKIRNEFLKKYGGKES